MYAMESNSSNCDGSCRNQADVSDDPIAFEEEQCAIFICMSRHA